MGTKVSSKPMMTLLRRWIRDQVSLVLASLVRLEQPAATNRLTAAAKMTSTFFSCFMLIPPMA